MGDPIIFESPALQSRRRRLLFGVVTFLLWTGWTYLWVPVLNFAGWLLGVPLRYQDFVLDGYAALGEVLLVYAFVISVMGGSLLAWAFYNRMRFQHLRRRRPKTVLDRATLAKYYDLRSEQLHAWQQARRLELEYDLSGRLGRVKL